MDREAWQATVHGVAKSRTRLSDLTFPGSHGVSHPWIPYLGRTRLSDFTFPGSHGVSHPWIPYLGHQDTKTTSGQLTFTASASFPPVIKAVPSS